MNGYEGLGASAEADRATAVEPVPVSPLRDGIPSAWQHWHVCSPIAGQKIVIVCDDGCSSSLAMMGDDGPIDGEDAFPLGDDFLRGAIWAPLPDDYQLAFMEATDADWY